MTRLRLCALVCLLLPACATFDADDDADRGDDAADHGDDAADRGDDAADDDGLSTTSLELRPPGDDDPPDCDDDNPCTRDTLRLGVCRHTRLSNGTACDDDADVCTGVGTCSAGVCVQSAPPSCDDGNACTDDWCEPSVGCVSEATTATCSDGNSCTVGDACSAGVCEGQGSTSGTIGLPAITDVVVSAPGGLLDRAPVYYLEGTELDVALTVPSCTYVTSIRVGDSTLTTAPRTACGEFDWPRDCEPQYYSIESDALAADGSRRLRLRLHLSPAPGDGASKPVTIVAASALGEATHALTLARVADAAPAFIELSLADDDLHNAFIGEVYAGYGDDGSQQLASGGTIYDPDYNATRMSILAENALRVRLDFSAVQDDWCNPRVHVDATYTLFVDADRVVALRDNTRTDVSMDFAWYCDLLGGFIQGIKAGMAEDGVVRAVDEAMGGLTERLTGELCRPETGCGGLVLASVPGELRIKLLNGLGWPAVAFDVDYDPNGAKHPSPYGLPLRAGENVVVTAAGIAATCDGATAPWDACFGVSPGPAGVPNGVVVDGDAAPPVPPPYEGGTYFAERAEARAVLDMVTRTPADLPRPDGKVGALMGKLAGATQPALIGTGPCQVATQGQDLLGFGANDLTRGDSLELGRGSYRVTVVFVPPTEDIPPCAP